MLARTQMMNMSREIISRNSSPPPKHDLDSIELRVHATKSLCDDVAQVLLGHKFMPLGMWMWLVNSEIVYVAPHMSPPSSPASGRSRRDSSRRSSRSRHSSASPPRKSPRVEENHEEEEEGNPEDEQDPEPQDKVGRPGSSSPRQEPQIEGAGPSNGTEQANAFYLFFPQANDRIMALEVADQAAAARYPVLEDPREEQEEEEEPVMTAKRTSAGNSLRRRSAESYHCPCLHKVCTYHCMTK
ncbi:unnamed protein product [Caenorhabditis sp. 36 PRJEB53466]|nr:unnamed protein product [Caenorhabditis sp. 36 PRJEB53466]